jgi:hypothetical protein
MNHTFKLAIALAAISIAPACKDKDEACVAGTGGNIAIIAKPQHHGKVVRPYEAWVKYNTNDAPGSAASNYDQVVAADTSEDHVHIANMKCGDYYIYVHGFDSAAGQTVRGGIPYTVDEGASGEVEVVVPVSE